MFYGKAGIGKTFFVNELNKFLQTLIPEKILFQTKKIDDDFQLLMYGFIKCKNHDFKNKSPSHLIMSV